MTAIFLNDPDLTIAMTALPDGAELVVTGDPAAVDDAVAEIIRDVPAEAIESTETTTALTVAA